MDAEEGMPSIQAFLESLRLSALNDLFETVNIVTVEQLLDFDDVQLKDIGVDKPGHRKRMLVELKSLRMKYSIENTRVMPQEPENTHDSEAVTNNDIKLEEPPPPIPPKNKVRKPSPPEPLPRDISLSPPQPIRPVIPLRTDLGEEDSQGSQFGVDDFDSNNSSEDNKDVKILLNASVKPQNESEEHSKIAPDFVPRSHPPNRSSTLPYKKRMAPAPPVKSPSFKSSVPRVEDSGWERSLEEDQKSLPGYRNSLESNGSTTHSQTVDMKNAEPIISQEQKEKEEIPEPPRSRRIDESFLNKISEALSPKRPAPMPPCVVQPDTPNLESPTDMDKSEDLSSDSEDDSSVNENGKATDSHPTTSLLESELVKLVSEGKRLSRLGSLGKSGFLEKRGGQNNRKGFQKRWVVFDGNDLRYYKPNDKDSRSDCLQIVPLNRMTDIKIVTGSKKPQFCLETPNRTFIFASDDHNEIGLWSNILMSAVVLNREQPTPPTNYSFGGSMCDPDKEGWLKKQGHNVRMDWKSRYVVVKDGKVAYYRNYEDYKQDLPINCLNMALSTLKTDPSRCRIIMKTAQQKDFLFEAGDEHSFQSWISAFETSIQMALGDTTVLDRIQENPSNKKCADCGKRNPVYASVNLLVIVCDACIGFHRKLGAQITKARSLLMDEKIWNDSLVKLMQTVGNENANMFWEHKMPDDDKISADSPSDVRYEFIVSKYKERRYMNFSEFYGQMDNLGEALRRCVITNNVLQTLQLLICGASVYYTKEGEDEKTPYQLATDANQELQMELLRQFNGHYTAEEREEERQQEMLRKQQEAENNTQKSFSFEPTIIWEKQGILLKRGPKNNEAWRPRLFYLLKRSLYYQKENEKELIDLKKIIDIQKGVNDDDPRTINIMLPSRTYYLKGETLADAEAWYTAIKNKQVFDVPIECQEVNSKNIPLLIAKCVDYVENYALHEEGIYRKNGSQNTMKNIKLLFNQDAPSVRLTADEYPLVHDVCGVLKLYLRQGLPEPLLTTARYNDFLSNSYQADHDSRLRRLYELVDGLPEVNKATLKCLSLHLNKITKNSDENKMNLQNVIRVFAPIIVNKGDSTSQQNLDREYKILDDILTYTSYLFNIDASETQQIEADIEKAKKKLEEAEKQFKEASVGCKIDELNQPIYLVDEQTCYSVKLTSKTTASEVCWYLVKLLSLSFDGNWALFEKIKGAGLERPLSTRELVLPIVMDSGSWGNQATFLLCMKNNYVAEMAAQYQSSMLTIAGRLHWRKDDESWKKDQYLTIKTGDLIVYNKEGGSEVERLSLHQWTVYIGVDERKKKSPKRYGFTLKFQFDRRSFCTDDEKYMYRWISAIFQIKYPSGIWTNLKESDRRMTALAGDIVPLDQRKTVFLGRQSMYLRAPGSSQIVQKEIQVKRKSLKKTSRR